MSDGRRKARTAAGTVLLLAALAGVLLPAVTRPGTGAASYRADPGRDAGAVLRKTDPEPGEGAVNVNTADAAELTRLRGIGESYAERILAEREANGPFFYPEDLETVNGIGPRTVEGIRNLIRTADE